MSPKDIEKKLTAQKLVHKIYRQLLFSETFPHTFAYLQVAIPLRHIEFLTQQLPDPIVIIANQIPVDLTFSVQGHVVDFTPYPII